MKFLKYFLSGSILVFVLIVSLLIYGYYSSHIQIDSKFVLINDSSGFGLINKNTGEVLVGNPIVWYCDTENYIIGCTGEDISDKPESYIPGCIQNGYFTVEKNSSKVTNYLSEKGLDDLNIFCSKRRYISK